MEYMENIKYILWSKISVIYNLYTVITFSKFNLIFLAL
jgi:hypothetical protein